MASTCLFTARRLIYLCIMFDDFFFQPPAKTLIRWHFVFVGMSNYHSSPTIQSKSQQEQEEPSPQNLSQGNVLCTWNLAHRQNLQNKLDLSSASIFVQGDISPRGLLSLVQEKLKAVHIIFSPFYNQLIYKVLLDA